MSAANGPRRPEGSRRHQNARQDGPRRIPHHRVVIVGAGISGVGMAVRLLDAGIDDFVLLERNPSVGGTWYEHTYPGCACDVPTHLYSYSFARNPNWSRLFPRQEEILEYVRETAARHGVDAHIRFECEMQHAAWDDVAEQWRVETPDGEITCDVLISAIGGTAEPTDPDITGWSSFGGHRFHSARWDHDHDLSGERVAVIGTGPAAAQFVPRIAPKVGKLVVFQRTAPWIFPHPDRAVPGVERALYKLVPQLQDAHRNLLFAVYEATGYGFHSNPAVLAPVEAIGRAHLRRQVSDPVLREQLTPHYRFGCKRPILSNTYYPALSRDNATLVTDSIARVNKRSITTADGTRHEVDTIISAVGYRYSRSLLVNRISGRGGHTLGEVWDRSPRAYLGSAVPGFPNMFILLGPNAIGINSAIFSLEAQMDYVTGALKTGARVLEVRPDALEDYVAEIDGRNEGTVWTAGGCRSYYLDDSGRQFALYPGFASQYRRRTRRFDAAAYDLAS